MSVLLPSLGSPFVDTNQTVNVYFPESPITDKSLQVASSQNKSFDKWTNVDHRASYDLLQKIAAVWKEKGIAEQYLVYGKTENEFKWEIVPFQKTNSIIGRFWQQFKVLLRITFGGISKPKQLDDYRDLFQEQKEKVENFAKGADPFCDSNVIDKQSVLAGRRVNVLYNYAPIGFGGERLHFLLVPKEHKNNFSELSIEEYLETAQLAQNIVKYFFEERKIEQAYFFHKNGVDAGQSVPHWHMHVVMTSNKAQDFIGKITVLKNMLFGSTPMKKDELQEKVASLREELVHFSQNVEP